MAVSSDVDIKVIKLTQESLGKVIKKPPLTEKLLKRPPFKYLHDIVVSVIKTTGFLSDLFENDELIVENVKEKEAKIAFLDKVIDVLGFLNDGPLNVKASKIVAGLEPEKTNDFLQILGKTIASKKETTNAVQKVLNGEKPSKVTSNISKTQSTKKTTKGKASASVVSKRAASTERRTSLSKPSSRNSETQSRSPLRASNKQSSKSKSPSPTATDPKSPLPSSASSNKENPKEVAEDQKNGEVNPDESTVGNNETLTNGKHDDVVLANTTANNRVRQAKSAKKDVPHLTVRPPTGNIKFMQKHLDEEEDKPARPTTARAAPPKVVSQRDMEEMNVPVAVEEEKKRLMSAKPVENLITEKDDGGEEDDLFLVEEAKEEEENEQELRDKVNSYDTGNDQKGSLVQQLVATKKELEGDKDSGFSSSDETMSKLAARDVEKLKDGIQMLTRLANPLGRVLDYLQEDVDTMISELHAWDEEYRSNMEQLQKENNVIDTDLTSLRSQLEEIDREINEQIEKISMTKSNITRKDETLKRMVDMVVEKGA